MFWSKKKNQVPDPPSDVLTLATRLGVERRMNVRVLYPSHAHVCKLPQFSYEGHALHAHDISVGGCCVLDPSEHMGPQIGQDIELEMHWTTGVEKIPARICARVDDRRHIQFLNLSAHRQTLLKKFMIAGVHGLSMRMHGTGVVDSPVTMSAELWSSLHGDSAILESDVHRLGQVQLLGDQFSLFREAWPVKGKAQTTCSRAELEQLILFLTNVPLPSKNLSGLLQSLEDLFFDIREGDGR